MSAPLRSTGSCAAAAASGRANRSNWRLNKAIAPLVKAMRRGGIGEQIVGEGREADAAPRPAPGRRSRRRGRRNGRDARAGRPASRRSSRASRQGSWPSRVTDERTNTQIGAGRSRWKSAVQASPSRTTSTDAATGADGARGAMRAAQPASVSASSRDERDAAQRGSSAAHLAEDEGIFLGRLVQRGPAAGPAAMAGAHVDLQQLEIVVGAHRAEARRPFGRLPIGDARIVEAAGDQHRRIGLAADIVVGAVAQHVAEGGRVGDRIAPFVPFARGQRQALVEHGVDDVDEGHVGDHRAPQFRRLN